MISDESLPLKKLSLFFLLICCGLVTAYIIFIGMISIRLGLRYLHFNGFWVPILAGTISITIILWTSFRISTFILRKLKKNNFIKISD